MHADIKLCRACLGGPSALPPSYFLEHQAHILWEESESSIGACRGAKTLCIFRPWLLESRAQVAENGVLFDRQNDPGTSGGHRLNVEWRKHR